MSIYTMETSRVCTALQTAAVLVSTERERVNVGLERNSRVRIHIREAKGEDRRDDRA